MKGFLIGIAILLILASMSVAFAQAQTPPVTEPAQATEAAEVTSQASETAQPTPSETSTETPPMVALMPSNLTINSQHCLLGISCGESASRTLLVNTNMVPLENVNLVASDLSSGSDVLPQANITEEVPSIISNSPTDIAVMIKTDNVASGAYNGNLLLTYKGGSVTIPTAVNVKDPFLVPLLVLLLGVAIGTTVTWFKQQQLPRDEIVIRIAKLTEQRRYDPQFDKVFGSSNAITDSIATVWALLEDDQVDQAKTTLDAAVTIFQNWTNNETSWLNAYDDRQKLKADLDSIINNHNNIIDLSGWYKKLPQFDLKDTALQKATSSLQNYSAALFNLQTILNYIGQIDHKLVLTPDTTLQQQRENLSHQLQMLDPSSPDLTTPLSQTAQSIWSAVDKLPMPTPAPAGAPYSTPQTINVTTVKPSVSSSSRNINDMVRQAETRRRIFLSISWFVLILVLVWTGFAQLYETKATFGAQPVADYLGLLLWGLGSEVARATITGVDFSKLGVGPNAPP